MGAEEAVKAGFHYNRKAIDWDIVLSASPSLNVKEALLKVEERGSPGGLGSEEDMDVTRIVSRSQ